MAKDPREKHDKPTFPCSSSVDGDGWLCSPLPVASVEATSAPVTWSCCSLWASRRVDSFSGAPAAGGSGAAC